MEEHSEKQLPYFILEALLFFLYFAHGQRPSQEKARALATRLEPKEGQPDSERCLINIDRASSRFLGQNVFFINWPSTKFAWNTTCAQERNFKLKPPS